MNNNVATALTVYGIETVEFVDRETLDSRIVATALTVYGIETQKIINLKCCKLLRLQQHLPFTVLKLK